MSKIMAYVQSNNTFNTTPISQGEITFELNRHFIIFHNQIYSFTLKMSVCSYGVIMHKGCVGGIQILSICPSFSQVRHYTISSQESFDSFIIQKDIMQTISKFS